MEVLTVAQSDLTEDQIARYLASFETEDQWTYGQWRTRLDFFWSRNPCHNSTTPKGWALVDKGKICGFLGAIRAEYQLLSKGKLTTLPALSATTWRVDSAYRGHSMQLFMRYLQAKKDHLLVDTTPTPPVEKILATFKFEGPYLSHNFVLPLAPGLLDWPLKQLWPARRHNPVGRKLTVNDLKNVKVQFSPPEGFFQRHVTAPFLQWYCFNGIREKCFYGLIENGELKSYLIGLREIFRGIPILRVVDFQAQMGFENSLHGLSATMAEDAKNSVRALIFTVFPDNPAQANFTTATWNKKKYDQHHYLFATPSVRSSHKWAMKMTDGDYGC